MMTRRRSRRGLTLAVALVLPAVLVACGPVPVDQAERSCLRDARMARAPQTEVELGVGVGGGKPRSYGSVSFEVSGDYLMGRDPADVFASCVRRQSGQQPSVPLYDQPGWQG